MLESYPSDRIDMEFRPARREDLPGILDLYRHLNPDDAPLPAGRADSLWDEVESTPGIAYFVGVHGGQILSTCNVVVVPNLTRSGRPWAVVENVVTHPDHQRRGLGKGVLEMAVAFARERNCYKIALLSSAKRRDAHRFYEAAGFDGDVKRGFHLKLEDSPLRETIAP